MVASVFNRFAPIDFTRYIDRLTERFTGREWLFEQIDHWLQQGNEQFYLLTGEPGVGKSAIAAKLTQLRNDIAAYHFCRAGDVETVRPGRVLRSLAAQLGRTLPHYGEALAKTIDPIHLRIEVNINIESLSNSQVTGIYIENLKESDPREELEILLRAPLALLTDLYAEHNEPLPTLKLLLIDSLDEAVTTTGRDNIATLLAALSQAEGLPAWIRFVLTARPDLQVLEQFESLRHYKLKELLAQNLEDIERYVQSRVQELIVEPSEFQARLEQAQLSAERLMHEVKDLSKGNFLYTTLLLDGIATGELSLKNLSALPKTLNEVYQRFLRNRCPFRKWSDRYQPILGTLTVTQEPVSEEQLVKFTGIDSKQLKNALGVLQQFLDEILEEVDDKQRQKTYAIFHQSLREYLLDKKRNQDFWCDAREQHDIVIECFEKESESWQDLKAIDQYGLRHLVQHLVQATRVEELHTLLGLEKEGRNGWFEAKDWIGDTSGFVADIRLAWDKADEEFERQSVRIIPLQCRYALMIASINSLANNIPPKLVAALVAKQKWLPNKGIAYALQIEDPLKRSEFIRELIPYLPKHVLEKIFASSCSMAGDQRSEYFRAKILNGLIPYLPEALDQAWTTTRNLRLGLFRSEALEDLVQALSKVSCLPEYLLEEMFASACNIGEDSTKAIALTSLIPYLPRRLLEQTLTIVPSIKYEHSRAQVMSSLIPYLPNVLEEVLITVRSTTDPEYFIDSLIQLIPYSPNLLNEALRAVRNMQDKGKRAIALSKIVPHSPDVLEEALTTAHSTQDEYHRVWALSKLIPYLPDVLQKAWTIVQNMQDEHLLVRALTILAPHLPNFMLEEALTIANSIQIQNYRYQSFNELAPYLSEQLLEKALNMIRKIQDEFSLTETLVELVPYLSDVPDVLEKALTAARNTQDNFSRALALIRLVPYFPDMVIEALTAARSIQDEYSRTMALAKLIPYLPDIREEAWISARSIPHEDNRAKALVNLLPYWSFKFDLKDKNLLQALSKIISRLRKPFEINLTQHYLEEILTTVRSMPGGYSHTKALVLLDLLPYKPKLWNETLVAAYSPEIVDNGLRAEILARLIPYQPFVVEEALIAARNTDSHGRVYALRELIHYLPDVLPEALVTVRNIEDEYYRADALKGLASYLPETLVDEALTIAYSIKNESYRATALLSILPQLNLNSISFWFKILRNLAYLSRHDFLRAIPILAPKIIALGTTEALLAVVKTMQDVCKQWR